MPIRSGPRPMSTKTGISNAGASTKRSHRAALHLVTTITGSALLAVALLRGRLDADQVWAAAHVDEDWNIEHWGIDEEVALRRAGKLVDFRAAAFAVNALVSRSG